MAPCPRSPLNFTMNTIVSINEFVIKLDVNVLVMQFSLCPRLNSVSELVLYYGTPTIGYTVARVLASPSRTLMGQWSCKMINNDLNIYCRSYINYTHVVHPLL
jgi:hypothetical protein